VASSDAVDALWTLLDTARGVVDELRRDGLLDSLSSVLSCMLPEDREGVLTILEHDAGGRTLVRDQIWSRFVLRPNPFAQIYSRPNTASHSPGVRYLESRRATVVGARLARALPPRAEEGWEPGTVEVWRRLEPAARARVVEMSRRALDVLEPNRRRVPRA
jgi:hypothetical protein